MIGLSRGFRSILKSRRERQLSPMLLNAGDTYLVEFPKSGITWMSMLVAHAFAIKLDLDEVVTLGSVGRFIPDLHSSRAVAPRLSSGGIRFYKSHSTFNRNYGTTIYLVRHPFDVMRSYHCYRSALDPLTPTDLGRFIDSQMGIPTWKEHIRSWLINPRDHMSRKLHLVRYEDLLKDAGAVLRELSLNLGWGLEDASIAEAVLASSREKMQMSEDVYRRSNPGHVMKFVGSGGSTPDQAILDKISRECRFELQYLGYEV